MFVFHTPMDLPDNEDPLIFRVAPSGMTISDEQKNELASWPWSNVSQVTQTTPDDPDEMDMLVFSLRDTNELYEFECEDTDNLARVCAVASGFSAVTLPENFKVCV